MFDREPEPRIIEGTFHHDVHPRTDGGLTLAEAAERLGINRDAIRQRIRRGKIDARKIDGQWFVYPDSSTVRTPKKSRADESEVHPKQSTEQVPYTVLVDQLHGEVAFLREELRRKDAIIARFAERVVLLPESTRPQQREDAEQTTLSDQSAQQEPRRRRWWWPLSY